VNSFFVCRFKPGANPNTRMMQDSAGNPLGPGASRAACRPHCSSAHVSSGLFRLNCFCRPDAQELCHGGVGCAELDLRGPGHLPVLAGRIPLSHQWTDCPIAALVPSSGPLGRRPLGTESSQNFGKPACEEWPLLLKDLNEVRFFEA
jgi:hypothetical protein